jgi:hypothetical protein
MRIMAFLLYTQYTTECPLYIDAGRWQGMLRWLATREAEGELPPLMGEAGRTHPL